MTPKRFFYRLAVFLSRCSAFFSKADALHKARFARLHELSDMLTDSLPIDSLLLAISQFSRILHVRATPARRELGNLLVVAPTRGGKGLLAVSQLLTYKGSVVVNDIKGELFDQTAGYRATLGPVFVIDPNGVGHRYDPLLNKHTEKDLLSAATHLLHRPDERDPIFYERASVMLTQMFLGGREEHAPLFPFVRQMIRSGPVATAKRLSRINPDLATQFLESALEEAHFDDRFFISCWGTLSVRMRFLLTDTVVGCLSGTDFTAVNIMRGAKPVTVYLRWPERDLLSLSPLVRLVWESLIGELIETYDNAKGKHCSPVLLLVDEAANCPIPSLARYASTVAGRGMTLWLALQSLSQLDALYGKHKADTIKNNCDSQLFYRQVSLETAQYVEHSLGYASGFARSHTLREGQESSQSLGEQAVPLFTAQDIKKLSYEEIIGFHANRPPFRAQRMDWRAFPILTQRRAISPPKLSPLAQLDQASDRQDHHATNSNTLWQRNRKLPNGYIDPDKRY